VVGGQGVLAQIVAAEKVHLGRQLRLQQLGQLAAGNAQHGVEAGALGGWTLDHAAVELQIGLLAVKGRSNRTAPRCGGRR